MAEINECIVFTALQHVLIEEKLQDGCFSHKNWGDKDLTTLRKVIRNFYRLKQKAHCAYCRNPVSMTAVLNCHIEHIAPKSKYRDFIFEPKNLCVICADCNQIKREQETFHTEPDTVKNGNRRKRYPRSTDAFRIVHPHFDNYDEHIVIFRHKYYVGRTDKGAFTIFSCRLNRFLGAFGWQNGMIDHAEITALMNEFIEEPDRSKRDQMLRQFSELLLIAG
jgi:uncharacterized protein (TIGR02646 family)